MARLPPRSIKPDPLNFEWPGKPLLACRVVRLDRPRIFASIGSGQKPAQHTRRTGVAMLPSPRWLPASSFPQEREGLFDTLRGPAYSAVEGSPHLPRVCAAVSRRASQLLSTALRSRWLRRTGFDPWPGEISGNV